MYPGVVGLIWCVAWWYIVKDNPENDPHISPEELKYIQDSLGDNDYKGKKVFLIILATRVLNLVTFVDIPCLC